MLSEVIARIRQKKPLIHCINNHVTSNDCANILLACGGSAIMADDPDEVTDVTAMCDGLVLNGYLGSDGIKPYLPYVKGNGKNIFVVVKSSNRSSAEVQDLVSGGRVIHTAMADLTLRWSTELFGKCGYGEVCAVVGLSSPTAIQALRRSYDTLFFLVPGYGTQGGVAKHASYAFDRFGHGAAVCASRSIIGAWRNPSTAAEAAVPLLADACSRSRAAGTAMKSTTVPRTVVPCEQGRFAGTDWPEAALAAVEKMKKQLENYVTVL